MACAFPLTVKAFASRLYLGLLLLVAGVAAFQLPKFEEDPGTGNFQRQLTLTPVQDGQELYSGEGVSQGPTFCVIARVTTVDLPYVESFLRHYARLGVNTIYLFNDHLLEEKHADIVQYLQALELAPSTKVKLMDFKEVKHDDPLGTTDLAPLLEEDFVINVDLDEFWVLPQNISDLPGLLREHPADIYFMRWVMVVDDDLKASKTPPYDGTMGFPGKYMVNRSKLPEEVYPRPFGHHTVPLRLDELHPTVYGDFTYGMPFNLTVWSVFGRPLPANGSFVPGYIAHLWGRSFIDAYLKIALRGDGPCRPLHEYYTEINERLATLAFLSLNEKMPVSVDVQEDMFVPDSKFENELALKAACEKDDATARASLEQFHQNYLDFKGKLSDLMQDGAYPTLWPTTALTLHMEGLSVSDWLHSLPLNVTQ